MGEWMEIVIKYHEGSKKKPMTLIFRKADVLVITKIYNPAMKRHETVIWFKVQKTIDEELKSYFKVPADCMDKLKKKLGVDDIFDRLEIKEGMADSES